MGVSINWCSRLTSCQANWQNLSHTTATIYQYFNIYDFSFPIRGIIPLFFIFLLYLLRNLYYTQNASFFGTSVRDRRFGGQPLRVLRVYEQSEGAWISDCWNYGKVFPHEQRFAPSSNTTNLAGIAVTSLVRWRDFRGGGEWEIHSRSLHEFHRAVWRFFSEPLYRSFLSADRQTYGRR